MKTRIVLADDHRIVREGLRSLLEAQPEMEVIAEAENGKETIRLVKELVPDMVIMDITMPEVNGIEATKKILEYNSKIKIIALSMHSDKRFVSEMLSVGASGYLLKDCAVEELARAIHVVLSNQIYVSPGIANVVVSDYVNRLDLLSRNFSSLTPKGREVVRLIAEGESTKAIASQLGVSVKTIETHRQHVMEKLNVHSVAELVKYAIREGLTSLEE